MNKNEEVNRMFLQQQPQPSQTDVCAKRRPAKWFYYYSFILQIFLPSD